MTPEPPEAYEPPKIEARENIAWPLIGGPDPPTVGSPVPPSAVFRPTPAYEPPKIVRREVIETLIATAPVGSPLPDSSAVFRPTTYEPPKIEQRDPIPTSLIGNDGVIIVGSPLPGTGG